MIIVVQVPSLVEGDVLGFPFTTSFNLATSSLSQRIDIRSIIEAAFLDEAFVDECIEIGIETPMRNSLFIVRVEFILNRYSLLEYLSH